MPDAFGGSFEVEHYRPESKFKDLRTEYSNLFYACRTCNGRKGNKWFERTQGGAYIVNPCEDAMAEHLWFEAGRVKSHSQAGALTEEIFRLNDAARLEARARIELAIVDVWMNLVWQRKHRTKLAKALNAERDAARRKKMEATLARLDDNIEERTDFLRPLVGRQALQYKL